MVAFFRCCCERGATAVRWATPGSDGWVVLAAGVAAPAVGPEKNEWTANQAANATSTPAIIVSFLFSVPSFKRAPMLYQVRPVFRYRCSNFSAPPRRGWI